VTSSRYRSVISDRRHVRACLLIIAIAVLPYWNIRKNTKHAALSPLFIYENRIATVLVALSRRGRSLTARECGEARFLGGEAGFFFLFAVRKCALASQRDRTPKSL
jgi:hypothetical protein